MNKGFLISLGIYVTFLSMSVLAIVNNILLCYLIFIYLKGCGTALKEAPPVAARETLPIVATKLETETGNNVADIFTKILSKQRLHHFTCVRGVS